MISSFGSFIARLTENIAFLLSSAAIILAFAALANAQATSEHQVVNVDQPDIRRTDVVSYNFSSDDNELLDQVQRGCFNYLWNEVGDGGLLAKDRRTTEVASLAGVGFQLASLPIGVERGWITRDEGRRRAATILNTLVAASNNRRDGVFLHFVNAKDAKLFPPYNNEISTVDHTLFLAGAMPAASYFGGDVAKQVDAIAAATNWRAFQVGDEGMISFAWKPTDNSDVSGTGAYMDLTWKLASDEERLVYFLATGCPTEQFAVEPQKYYHLLRRTGQLNDMPPFVVSWNGALFTYFFSHCYINYRAFDADDPAQFGESGPRVDWFENSRRATLAHRQRCIEYADKFSTFATDRWGLSPCMGKIGSNAHWDYLVQDLLPNWSGREETFRGTIAPYAAGSSIMFTPSESMTALHAFRNLKGDDGKPLAWREPTEGGYAFVDSFNVETQVASDDNIAIDVGPMLLAIENARTGLIWKLFMQHADAQRAVARLRLAPLR